MPIFGDDSTSYIMAESSNAAKEINSLFTNFDYHYDFIWTPVALSFNDMDTDTPYLDLYFAGRYNYTPPTYNTGSQPTYEKARFPLTVTSEGETKSLFADADLSKDATLVVTADFTGNGTDALVAIDNLRVYERETELKSQLKIDFEDEEAGFVPA